MDYVQFIEEVLQKFCIGDKRYEYFRNYRKKREKQELTNDEIKYFVDAYVNEQIADYQAAALVMAIFLNGMSKRETTDLTLAMAHSGEILDLKSLNKIIVDKHSTGGVGDKVSICLLPLVASLGVPVAKMSGRGLGLLEVL